MYTWDRFLFYVAFFFSRLFCFGFFCSVRLCPVKCAIRKETTGVNCPVKAFNLDFIFVPERLFCLFVS